MVRDEKRMAHPQAFPYHHSQPHRGNLQSRNDIKELDHATNNILVRIFPEKAFALLVEKLMYEGFGSVKEKRHNFKFMCKLAEF